MLPRAQSALCFRTALLVGWSVSIGHADPTVAVALPIEAKSSEPADHAVSDWRHSLQTEFKYIPSPTLDVGVRLRAEVKKSLKSDLDLPPTFFAQEKIADLQYLDNQLDYSASEPEAPAEEVADISPSTANSNVVLLPAFVVRDLRFNYGELKMTLHSQEFDARADAIQAKLGNQLHVYQLSRHFGVGYMTVFHIPIIAGFGWSW